MKTQYWTELAEYDIETARAMLDTKRLLYVGFMCHQAVEKIFKAYFIYLKNKTAPFSHSLSYLAKKGNFFNDLNKAQIDFIDTIEPLNIEARYPSHKERLLNSLTEKRCKDMLEKSKELQIWIKNRL